MSRGLLLLVCATLLPGCCKSPAPQGGAGQACYPNHTCNLGLACLNGECVGPGPDCGNGVCDSNEDALSCPTDCGNSNCGDGVINGTADEACDGTDLAGATCATEGFVGGELGCLPDCTDYDTSDCNNCGDSLIQVPEICDASNLAGFTCADYGFITGTLICDPDCLGHDTSSCSNGCEFSSCNVCIASACAEAVCGPEIEACSANPVCVQLTQCIDGCTDSPCMQTCENLYPGGVNDYNAAETCLVCDPAVCYDECDGLNLCP